MERDMQWLPTIIDSALGAVPCAGSALQNAFTAWRQNNINTAREALLANVRQGDVEALEQDQLFSMLARFTRSVQEGKAKANLILLARLISGIGHIDKVGGKAETFNVYSDMFESLTEEEIEFLSVCIKTGHVQGDEEMLNNLQYKGFLTSVSSNQLITKPGVIIQTGPPIPQSVNSAKALQEMQKVSGSAPYDIDTSVIYSFSKRFSKFLEKYGNLLDGININNLNTETIDE